MSTEILNTRKGEKQSGFLKVPGCGYELPVTVVRGDGEKTALITAGIHSAEYVGIQAAIELAEELRPEEVSGRVIVAPLINVSGFARRTMSMVYEDGKNLNREFPGNPEGTAADQICHAIVSEFFPEADYYVDLHSGDGYEEMCSYVYYVGAAEAEIRRQSLEMARQVEAGYLVESGCTTGGAYNYASMTGIPSVLIERGGRGLWNRKEVELDKRDVRRILARLGILRRSDIPENPVKEQLVFHRVVYEHAPEGGCWYPAFRAGEWFRKGEAPGEIRDSFGKPGFVCRAEEDGMILYQTVSLTVVKGGPMVAYGVCPDQLRYGFPGRI